MIVTYKHLEFAVREDGIVNGKACIFAKKDNQFSGHGEMYNFSSVSRSEAECLCDLNKQIAAHVKRLEELNA